LVLRFNVLDTLEPLLSALKLLLPSLDFTVKFSLVQAELLHSVIHLSHFPGLIVNDVANGFFDIGLLGVGIQVAADRVQEFEGLVTGLSKVPLLAKEVKKLGP